MDPTSTPTVTFRSQGQPTDFSAGASKPDTSGGFGSRLIARQISSDNWLPRCFGIGTRTTSDAPPRSSPTPQRLQRSSKKHWFAVGFASYSPVTGLDAPEIPRITAERWITYDANAEVILASWNANDQAPMASVTKVMTAILVLESQDLGSVVTIPSFATGARGSTAGLVAGEQWTVGDLLIAMIVRSGNDAALSLAYHVGGESISRFVSMMNAKASELGMANTHFMNPNGLDTDGHYSTARDLLTLIIASQEYPDIQRVGRIRLVTMPEDPNGKSRTFTNTNKLLGSYPGVTGLKTGDTPWADKVMLATSERAGRRIYSVVGASTAW